MLDRSATAYKLDDPTPTPALPVLHPKLSIENIWRDIVNFSKGFDNSEVLHVKFCSDGLPGDEIEHMSLGYVDGIGRAIVMHMFMFILCVEAGNACAYKATSMCRSPWTHCVSDVVAWQFIT